MSKSILLNVAPPGKRVWWSPEPVIVTLPLLCVNVPSILMIVPVPVIVVVPLVALYVPPLAIVRLPNVLQP